MRLAKYLYEKETITGSEFMKILQDKEGARNEKGRRLRLE